MRAAAEDITFSCETLRPQQFQEFQPIGGVKAIFEPTFRVNSARASPFALRAMKTPSRCGR